jgi:hypothetical protein
MVAVGLIASPPRCCRWRADIRGRATGNGSALAMIAAGEDDFVRVVHRPSRSLFGLPFVRSGENRAQLSSRDTIGTLRPLSIHIIALFAP